MATVLQYEGYKISIRRSFEDVYYWKVIDSKGNEVGDNSKSFGCEVEADAIVEAERYIEWLLDGEIDDQINGSLKSAFEALVLIGKGKYVNVHPVIEQIRATLIALDNDDFVKEIEGR